MSAVAAMIVALLVQTDPVAAFEAELRQSNSATAVLQRRCGAPIRAEVDRAAVNPPSPEQRVRLAVDAGELVAYRRVALRCGEVTLSVAENWYVPARLTPEIRAALAGDTPFGAAIRPLSPTRRTLASERDGPGYMLRHRALVLAGDGTPLAEVVENYQPAALAAVPFH